MRCAVVHDWLTGQRGGEHVLEAVLELLPSAELFCLTHVPGSVSPAIEARRPRVSWLGSVPGLRARPGLALPLLPRAVESLELEGHDAVLSISHCAAIGARTRGAHLAYSLSPMRYAWDGFEDYARGRGRLARAAGASLRARLQAWDRRAGARPRGIAAISELVRGRVRAAYGRDARVVYPPVDTEAFARARVARGGAGSERFLALGAVRPNKRLEDVARAFATLGLPLDVVGHGRPSDLARLRALGGPTVAVHGELSRERVLALVASCRALVHAAHEDFGIAPVEALAAGRPVVAFARSGVCESVASPGEATCGVLYEDEGPEALVAAVRRFLAVERDLPDAAFLARRAERFSRARFRESFGAFLREEGGAPFVAALAAPAPGAPRPTIGAPGATTGAAAAVTAGGSPRAC